MSDARMLLTSMRLRSRRSQCACGFFLRGERRTGFLTAQSSRARRWSRRASSAAPSGWTPSGWPPSGWAAGAWAAGAWAAGWALAAFCAVAYLPLLRADSAGTFHDDGLYLVGAKALAEGSGYRIASLPGEPAQTKYPVLFSWALSWVWSISPSFPENLRLLKLVPLAAGLAWLWGSRRLALRWGGSPAEAAGLMLLAAASPWSGYLSTSLMSETLFAALTVYGLLALDEASREGSAWPAGLLAGLLAGGATLTRLAGVALAAACLVTLATRRRGSALAGCAAGLAVTAGPWFGWVRQQNAAAALYDAYYSASSYGAWSTAGAEAWSEKLDVAATNLLLIGCTPFLSWGIEPGAWAVLPGLAAAAIFVRGAWQERRHPATAFVGVYLLMLLVWPWLPQRFLAPILPVLAWLAWRGAGRLRPLAAAAAVVLFASGAATLWGLGNEARVRQAAAPIRDRAEDWPRIEALLAWIDRHAAEDAVLAGNLDPAYYLYTGRRAVRAFSANPYRLFYDYREHPENPLGDVEALRRRLQQFQVDYLLLERGAGFAETAHLKRLVGQLQAEDPAALERCAGDEASGYVVYRVRLPRAAAEGAR